MSEWKIALSDLNYGAEEEAAVSRILRRRWLTMGEETEAFEHEFARFIGAKHAVAVSSGTAALHLAFLAAGIGAGDEVIQPALNFVAAANMTVACGATPVFGDITSIEEPTLDPGEIRRLATKRTKAVVVMHYGGHLCRMSEITEICASLGICVIEDASHAVGARYLDASGRIPHGKLAGALGSAAAFSFFSNKNLAAGEGGMVTTDGGELAERVRRLRSHGMTALTWDRHRGHASGYDVLCHGWNYRIDEIRAALGRVQLLKLESGNQRRQKLTSIYQRLLFELAGWAVPFADCPGESACHLMVAVAPDERSRSGVADALKRCGIQTSLHYPCIADFQGFASFRTEGLRNSREFSRRAITLPLYPGMSEGQVEEVCSRIVDSCDKNLAADERGHMTKTPAS